MRHGSLFSGIGGFDLAAEWCGWENVFHCEWNEFGQKVLKHYWPNSESFGDITKTDFTKFYGTVDIISGGFPCQPYSSAGKRLGKEDERHLWPEMLRVIREVGPRYVVGENVYGLLNWNGGLVFDEVHADLAAEGYETQAVVIPAAAKNAPHGRDRVWLVAHSLRNGRNERNGNDEKQPSERGKYAQRDAKQSDGNGNATDTEHKGLERHNRQRQRFTQYRTDEGLFIGSKSKFHSPTNWNNFPTEPSVCGGNDGLPRELDGITFSKWRNESIKAYGNAIVPQVAYEIFKTIDFINKQENA